MTPGLGDVVEFVFLEIKAPHQSADATGVGVHRHKGPFHLGQLGSFPGVFGGVDDPDDRATSDLDVGRCLVRQTRLHGFEAIATDVNDTAIGNFGADFFGVHIQHHGGQHIAVVGVIGQGVVDRIIFVRSVGGQIDKSLGAAINLPPFIVHQTLAQGFVGHLLLGRVDGGVDIQAARVGLRPILGHHQLPHRLGQVIGMDWVFLAAAADVQLFFVGFLGFLFGDEAVFFHAVDDVLLPGMGALGVADRVVGRRRFGQARQHGGFGNAEVFDGFAKIGFSGRSETIGLVAQINLVHVNLKDLVLGQHVLQFVGEQHLVDLAGVGFLGAQVSVARQLHGDGGSPLAFGAAQVGDARSHHAPIVNPIVLVKTRIFGGNHRVFHDLRNLVDGGQFAVFIAKLRQDRAVGGQDPQGQLGLVVSEVGNVGQFGEGHHHRHGDQNDQAQQARHAQSEQAKHHIPPPGARGFGRRLARVGICWGLGRGGV